MDDSELLVGAQSRPWRRQLGALAWAVLEELALAAHRTGQAVVAPIGVRDIAAGIGVTKDTAARATATLCTADLVSFERVQGRDGRYRTGYRLQLPEGLYLRRCPADHDTAYAPALIAGCPDGEDKLCPEGEDAEASQVVRESASAAGTASVFNGSSVVQPALFDFSPPES